MTIVAGDRATECVLGTTAIWSREETQELAQLFSGEHFPCSQHEHMEHDEAVAPWTPFIRGPQINAATTASISAFHCIREG